MQISTEGYFLERRRHDLALRMIRHAARTQTISICTGLTESQIRRLYRSYALHRAGTPLTRHRGKSPRQVAYFTSNTRTQLAASVLANVCTTFGLLDRPAQAGLVFAWRFCDAYETHLVLMQETQRPSELWQLSFEHAWFLLQQLRSEHDLCARRCPRCAGQYVHAWTERPTRPCPVCRTRTAVSRRRAVIMRPPRGC